MAIIKSKQKEERTQVRVTIENRTLETIKKYCEWAGVEKQDEFFEQAAEYILSKDKEWQKHINQAIVG